MAFDEVVHPKPVAEEGTLYVGQKGLLRYFETYFGLAGHLDNNAYLRIAFFRRAILQHLTEQPTPFYKTSFEANHYSTTVELLARRDELVLANWNFEVKEDTPERLRTLAEIEVLLQKKHAKLTKKDAGDGFPSGFADRWMSVLRMLDNRKAPIATLHIFEPQELLPFHIQHLIEKINAQAIDIQQFTVPSPSEDTSDLAAFQRHLHRIPQEKNKAQADGSLLILRAKRETEAATYLAQFIRRNPDFQPVCIIPEKNRALENALLHEGLPALGILSSSSARAILQILKLVTAFIWRPIDPFKIMEFVSMPVKPLDDALGHAIAAILAQSPGIRSDRWNGTILKFFEDAEAKAKADPTLNVAKIREQYEFWFTRRRYDTEKTAPKSDLITIFDYLSTWAHDLYEAGNKSNSLLVLVSQADRIKELLEASPEMRLSFLDIERIIRTVYEPAPVQFAQQEQDCLPYTYHPAALRDSANEVVWWNFVQAEVAPFHKKWYPEELSRLQNEGIILENAAKNNALASWQRKLPALMAQKKLLLVIPESVQGKAVQPDYMLGDVEVALHCLDSITFHVGNEAEQCAFEHLFNIPEKISLIHYPLLKTQPLIAIQPTAKLGNTSEENFTSLEHLFYYPYQWMFRHKARLKKSSILNIVNERTMVGNLAHRFFEMMLQEDISNWHKRETELWIDEHADDLLAKEGAVLLMYGKEPEKYEFLNKMKQAAWSLIATIQHNGWRVYATEKMMEGMFAGFPVKGKADLVLERNGEMAIIDMKWSGAGRRRDLIKNEADLQLVLYSRLTTPDDSFAHTAFFIIDEAKFVARNNEAFKDVIGISPDADFRATHQRIWDKMHRTFNWRMAQLRHGKIEVRTAATSKRLEGLYMDELLDILELPDTDAKYDDYRTLIHLFE